MDWNMAKNRKHLLLLLLLCGVIPHTVLSLLQWGLDADRLLPVEFDTYSHFFICEWIPFWAAFLAYSRQQKQDNFSLLPALLSGLIVLTFLPRYDQTGVRAIARTIPLLLVLECFAILKKWENGKNKLLAGIAANRNMIRAVFFWSVAVLCVAHIALAGMDGIVYWFYAIPFPGIMVFSAFRKLDDRPPTLGGVIAVLLMVPLSIVLAASGPMAFFKKYHIAVSVFGYVCFLLLQFVYQLDHWRKPKATTK